MKGSGKLEKRRFWKSHRENWSPDSAPHARRTQPRACFDSCEWTASSWPIFRFHHKPTSIKTASESKAVRTNATAFYGIAALNRSVPQNTITGEPVERSKTCLTVSAIGSFEYPGWVLIEWSILVSFSHRQSSGRESQQKTDEGGPKNFELTQNTQKQSRKYKSLIPNIGQWQIADAERLNVPECCTISIWSTAQWNAYLINENWFDLKSILRRKNTMTKEQTHRSKIFQETVMLIGVKSMSGNIYKFTMGLNGKGDGSRFMIHSFPWP